MNFWEIFRMSSTSLRGNKMRSFLTALGIIIGVGAVIALISVGQGASKNISDSIANMGSNLIIVSPQRNSRLNMEDIPDLLERVPTISHVVPSVTFNSTVKWQSNTHSTSIEGTSVDFPEVRNIKVAGGRFFTETETASRTKVAIIGQTVATELFGEGARPLGETILINGQSFTVIGLLEKKGSSMGRDTDDIILIPVSVAQRLSGSQRIGSFYIKAKGPKEAELAVEHITAIYDAKFRREDSIRVTSQDELLETINTTTKTFTFMLGAIAGISLLVGGIGIMNIMLVSVTERTREIGIRKALGAKRRDIMAQFIVESIFLSTSGGVFGIFLGIGLSKAIANIAGWITVISPTAIIISFLFALGVGLFFGVYPAYKAAHLDPIEALRHE
jgi:putative ABC transport system permease protein